MKRAAADMDALGGLSLCSVLNTDPDTGSAFALATSTDGKDTQAVVLLRKTPFREEDVKAIIEEPPIIAPRSRCHPDDLPREARRTLRKCNRTTSTPSIGHRC